MESFKKVFKKGSKRVKRALGQEVSSDSDSGYDEVPPYNPADDLQLQERKRRYEETGRQRAESPTRMQTAHADQRKILKARRIINKAQEAQAAQEQASLRREAAEFTHNFEINEMIKRISEALRIDVDEDDPRIRFVIGQIVNAHGLTLHSLRLMRRSRILLSAVGDIAARTGRNALSASEVVYNAGQAVLDAIQAARRFASRGASVVTSRLPSLPSIFSSQPGASGQRARSPDSFPPEQGPPNLGFQEVPFSVQEPTLLERQLEMDRNLQLQYSSAPASAPASAPPPLPPPPPPASTSAPDAEEDICTICMAGPGINDSGIDRGQLGYIERHSILAQGHPNKFHNSCLQECLRLDPRCPMCRAVGPVWGLERPPGQGGGGLKKYRSRSKSKSKSKTRRLRKSRKPRKSCKSRKPRSLSYRRK